MKNPLKEKVRFWFEFLKLAHLSPDAAVKAALDKSQTWYAPWGNYRDADFESWWKTNSGLFRKPVGEIRVMDSDERATEDAFCLRVPFGVSPNIAAKAFQRLYKATYESKHPPKRSRVRKDYGGSFELTPSDCQTVQFNYYLAFAMKVYLPMVKNGVKVSGNKLAEMAAPIFKRLPKPEGAGRRQTPFIEHRLDPDIVENQRRLALRYRNYSQRLLANAAAGVFPGDYEDVGIKNQSAKRKKPKPERSSARGVSDYRYQARPRTDKPLDPYGKSSTKPPPQKS